MKIASIVTDRRLIVKALEEATGFTAQYLHAPTFSYEIGPYIVDREGSITVKEGEEDIEILSLLEAKDLIRIEEYDIRDTEKTTISFPMDGYDAQSLKNLVFMLYSKKVLLSKAVRRTGWFQVSEKLIKDLDAWKRGSEEEFFKILDAAGDRALRGLSFEDGKIKIHFPYTDDPERIAAFTQLSELMAKAAREHKRVLLNKSKTTNEKYFLRVWLIRLGMTGDEYKSARKILLHDLNGHVAFRTKDQADVAREKLKKQREEAREAAKELAFIEL